MTSSPLESAIEKGRAATTMTIYHIDAYTTTRTAIRPDQIESFPDVARHSSSDRATIEAALKALQASHPVATTETREYRWKVVFEDGNAARLLEVYAHSFQPFGQIGDTPVAFANETFVAWLRERYAPNERPASTTSG